ncbi:MAG: activator-dependent family glycosyltransferase [Pseudonocardiaceae bacterium]
MRVLVTPFSARSHLYNVVPIAWALQNAGHEVRVSCHPDEADFAPHTGLTAVSFGKDLNIADFMQRPDVLDGINWDIAEDDPDKLTWDYVHSVFAWYTSVLFRTVTDDETMDDAVAFAREWQPDLVLWDPLNFSGPVAARASGAAHARMLFGLDFVVRMRRVFLDLQRQRAKHERSDPLGDWLAETLARFGCAFDEEVVTGHWSIDPLPPGMRFPIDLTYVSVRYPAFNGASCLPRWLHEPPKKRRICLTLGLSGRELFGEDGLSISDLLAAMAELDVEVVATLDPRQLDGVGELPDNVRVADFIPLNALLPTCSAVIHHGGATTCGTAIEADVPQLVVYTKVWDKAAIAEYVADNGAGFAVNSEHFTVTDLRAKLSRLLNDPSFSDGTRRVRQAQLALPTPHDIVPVMERLTARHRSRP